MQMNFWREIESNLWDEGFDVMNENNSIQWESEKGSHKIELKNIAINGDKLAWYQDEEYGRCWVKIKHPDGIILNWRPFSNHSDFGFRFYYIKWFENKLILIYGEKHREYIIKIENLKVETLYVGDISEIQIENKFLFVKNHEGDIQIINLNSEQTEVCKLTNSEFLSKFPDVNLKTYSYFFMNFENEYNKNYS